MTKPVILIPRPASPSTATLVAELKARGLEVIAEPLIEIEALPAAELQLRPYADVCDYDWLVGVSDKAIEFWLAGIANYKENLGFSKDLSLRGLPPIWVPGATTAECVEQYGGKALLPTAGTGSPAIYDGMLQHCGGTSAQLNNKRILTICGKGGGKELDKLLGREADKKIVYHTTSVNTTAESKLGQQARVLGAVNYVWLTSESMLNAFNEIISSKGNYPAVYMTAKIIAGSKRLEILAHELFKGELYGKIVGLDSPTNDALLDYLSTKL